jgi:hypothetical protein
MLKDDFFLIWNNKKNPQNIWGPNNKSLFLGLNC